MKVLSGLGIATSLAKTAMSTCLGLHGNSNLLAVGSDAQFKHAEVACRKVCICQIIDSSTIVFLSMFAPTTATPGVFSLFIPVPLCC